MMKKHETRYHVLGQIIGGDGLLCSKYLLKIEQFVELGVDARIEKIFSTIGSLECYSSSKMALSPKDSCLSSTRPIPGLSKGFRSTDFDDRRYSVSDMN